MAFFGLGSRSYQPNRLGSVQIGTSEYGVAVPIGWGQFKAPVKLLDYTDFSSVPVKQGGKGNPVSSYEYYASCDFLLCRGPIGGIGNLYDSGGSASLVGVVETFTIPAGGGTYQVSNGGYGLDAFYIDEGVTTLVSYTVAGVNDFGSDGSITLSGTQPAPFEKTTGTVGAMEYAVDVHGLYSFSASDAGKLVSITYAYTIADLTNINSGPGTNAPLSPVQRYNLSVIAGAETQMPWSYMLTAHPERALGYAGLARMVGQNIDMGSSGTTPNLSGEILNGRLAAFGSGIADCDPAAVIADALSGDLTGCNWPYLGDLTQYSNFCVANNLFLSPFYDSVTKALRIVQDLCDLTNSEPVWSGAALKIVPYGDTTAVGNGRTYSPTTEPVYLIDEDEFLCREGEEALKVADPDLADNYNRVQWEYQARNDNYNTQLIHEQDAASIQLNGLLPMKTVTAHHFKVQFYAAVAMNMMLRRQSVPLRVWEGTLPWYYQLLEPMDIVLVNTSIGNNGVKQLVPLRVTACEEDDEYRLKIEFEDFLWGVANGVQYPKGAPVRTNPTATALPGATTLLAAFEPTARLTGGSVQLWLALSGGSQWGGCQVWWSLDGTTYSPIGTQYGSARAGTLTAALPAGSDPDTTDTAAVTVSGSLSSVTDSAADSFATLSLVGTELISYANATITGSTAATNSYALTYLRRGVFASMSQSHPAGTVFVRLDDKVFQYTVDPSLIGKTVYLKFTSFNIYGAQEQAIGNVQSYAFVIAGLLSASTMRVGSYLNPGGATATVNVYLPGGANGASGTAVLPNGAVIALPAFVWTAEATATFYAVNYNPVSASYVLYTSANAWLADQNAGLIGIGSTTTPSAASSGSYAFDNYADTGSTPTQDPSGAYTAGASSLVNASAAYTPNRPTGGPHPIFDPTGGTSSNGTGICSWSGAAGTTTAVKTLSVEVAIDVTANGGGSAANSVTATLDGSSYTTLISSAVSAASATYTLSIPSGTNLANVVVQASSRCLVPSGGTAAISISATIAVSNLTIS